MVRRLITAGVGVGVGVGTWDGTAVMQGANKRQSVSVEMGLA